MKRKTKTEPLRISDLLEMQQRVIQVPIFGYLWMQESSNVHVFLLQSTIMRLDILSVFS